jgi:hypothetical protein
MKRLAFCAALLAVVALCQPSQAFGFGGGYSRGFSQNQRFVVQQRQFFVQPRYVYPAQQFVLPVVAPQYVAPALQQVVGQQYGAPVVQQVVVPGCNAFFVK